MEDSWILISGPLVAATVSWSGPGPAVRFMSTCFMASWNSWSSPSQISGHRYCPVKLLQKYLALRPSGPGPVFVSTHGKPITRQQFLGALHSSVRFRSLDPSLYNTHSFRIGRSTDMMVQGYSDAQIRAVGRWKSDAYKRYIRPDIISA